MICPRIAILIGSLKIGGSELQAALLAKSLKQKEVQVYVFCMDRPFRFNHNQRVDFSPVKVWYLWDLSRLIRPFSLWWFRFKLKLHNIEVLHLFNISIEDPFFGAEAANYPNGPTIISGVRNMHFTYNYQYRTNLKRLLNYSDGRTCNSMEIRKQLEKATIIKNGAINVINNGVVSRGVNYSELSTLSRTDVLFVGSLKKIKDPTCFIESAIITLEKGYQCRFVIAGDGNMRETLESICHKSGYNNHFIFLGNVPQKKIPFQTARVLVSTSLHEGNSNSILEALANGVPVISTAVGGSIELIRNTSFGTLVPPQKPEQTAKAIQCWLDTNVHSWIESSISAKKTIDEAFSLQTMTDKHIDLYLETNA